MLQIARSQKYGTHIPGVGVSSSTSQASDEHRNMLKSIKEAPSGTNMSYRTLYQSTLHSIMGFYYGSPQNEISIADVKMVVRGILRNTLTDLHELLTWNDGWNGYDACAPKHAAITNAIDWVIQLFLEVMDLDEDWVRPNVTASGEGEVVFGWRRGPKRLTIYIGEKDIEYVRAWGPDINKDMDDGDANLTDTRQSLWKWLVVEE